ncbi:MAG: alpha-L-rhamnosidase-related protein, partial [Tepidisphaeraceae bacterium]
MISDDPRVRSYIAPARVSWPAPAPPPPPGAERLITESIGQPSVWRPALCALSAGVANQHDAPMLFCDFGRELHGGVQLVIRNTTANRPVRLRITFGESIAEALAEPNQDHAIHQCVTEVPWAGIHEVGCTGFRFVRIELVDPGTFVELQGLRAVTLMRPEPVLGTFECNDPRINDIWATAVHTLRLCMQDYLWDGAKRDRLVWAGDLHPEVMTVLATFGGHAIVPASLDYLRDDAPLPQWMNGMPTYSMWWLITLRDWHLHTGDASTLKRARGYLVALVRQMAQLVGADGRDHLPARFLDWASQKSPDAVAVGSRALLKLALQAGGELCRTLGDVATAAHADDAADRLAGVEQPPVHNQQANALCVLAGLADAERTNAQCFAPSPMRGLSPFYGYYVLEARAQAGDHAGALNLLRTYWGGMLDLGATTFWEHFDASWLGDHPTRIDEWPIPGRRDVHRDYGEYCYQGFRHSLCHAWSSGPAPWL